MANSDDILIGSFPSFWQLSAYVTHWKKIVCDTINLKPLHRVNGKNLKRWRVSSTLTSAHLVPPRQKADVCKWNRENCLRQKLAVLKYGNMSRDRLSQACIKNKIHFNIVACKYPFCTEILDFYMNFLCEIYIKEKWNIFSLSAYKGNRMDIFNP